MKDQAEDNNPRGGTTVAETEDDVQIITSLPTI